MTFGTDTFGSSLVIYKAEDRPDTHAGLFRTLGCIVEDTPPAIIRDVLDEEDDKECMNFPTTWEAGKEYHTGQVVQFGENVYCMTSVGEGDIDIVLVSGTTGPVHTAGTVSDGAIDWQWKSSLVESCDDLPCPEPGALQNSQVIFKVPWLPGSDTLAWWEQAALCKTKFRWRRCAPEGFEQQFTGWVSGIVPDSATKSTGKRCMTITLEVCGMWTWSAIA